MAKIQTSISLEPDILKKIDALKKKAGRSRNWAIEVLLKKALLPYRIIKGKDS